MMSLKDIRAAAREDLEHDLFGQTWAMSVLVTVLYSIILFASAFTIVGPFILVGPLDFGQKRFYLNLSKGRESKFGDAFDGFTGGKFVDNFVLGLLETVFLFLWGLLLIIPGIIKSYSYALSFYIKNDDPTKDWSDCHKQSIEMMKGHKGKLFLLDLTFIGWYIVGFIALGVGVFWVRAYHLMARSEFYQELKKEN